MTKTKRELAVINIRVYPSAHIMVKEMAEEMGKSIARVNYEVTKAAYETFKSTSQPAAKA